MEWRCKNCWQSLCKSKGWRYSFAKGCCFFPFFSSLSLSFFLRKKEKKEKEIEKKEKQFKNCLSLSTKRANTVNWFYQRVRMVLYHAETSDQREGVRPSFNVRYRAKTSTMLTHTHTYNLFVTLSRFSKICTRHVVR